MQSISERTYTNYESYLQEQSLLSDITAGNLNMIIVIHGYLDVLQTLQQIFERLQTMVKMQHKILLYWIILLVLVGTVLVLVIKQDWLHGIYMFLNHFENITCINASLTLSVTYFQKVLTFILAQSLILVNGCATETCDKASLSQSIDVNYSQPDNKYSWISSCEL
ncbi:unnamed protein product [Paramecium sonneborni]|uniref:Transmembrane protein n=1 Tax=Paramecium sonneborni TaxID=65129 RepID=A0A8S1RR46_9CILI|nr:unnamed protein product [Paramecium sonneborni]